MMAKGTGNGEPGTGECGRVAALAWTLLVCIAALPAAGEAQGFQGVVRQRGVTVPPYMVSVVADGATTLADAGKVFAVPMERFIAAPQGSDASTRIQVVELTYSFLGTRVRTDFRMRGSETGDLYILYDSELETTVVVFPAEKTFLVGGPATLDRARELSGGAAQMLPQTPGAATSMSPLQERTVNGFAAEGFEIRVGDEALTRGWTAPAVQGAQVWNDFESSDPHAVLAEWGLPVLFQTLFTVPPPLAPLFGGGYVYTVVETLSAERGVVPEALFELPIDYQRKW